MDRFELMEKLVKTTGAGYEDAKNALEATGWDLLDAAVWLEKNGKIENRSARFNTDPEQQKQEEESVKQENTANEQSSSERRYSRRGTVVSGILAKIKNILIDNDLVLCKQSGEVFLDIPIWLAILLLVIAFWPSIFVLALVFFLGFRIRLQGPDIGSDKVNRIIHLIEQSIGSLFDRLKGQTYTQNNDRRGSTTRSRGEDVIDYEEPHRKE